METIKAAHGGKRQGAGRKPLPDSDKRKQMNIKVTDEERKAVIELLEKMRNK